MKIQNNTFVITGAGSGIGAEIAKILLSSGAKVAAVDLSEEGLDVLKNQVPDTAHNLSLHTLNVSDKSAVDNLPSAVMAAHGSIDGVINCAGIIQPFVKVNDLNFEAIERVINVNLYGTLYMVKAFLPELLTRPESSLVNVSSMGGFLPVPGQSVYGASKAAVKLLTEGLYAELVDTQVHVSVVFPGATKTNITDNSNVSTSTSYTNKNKGSSFPMLSAEKAAAIIVKGIEKNKLYIYTGKDSKMMNRAYRIRPLFAVKLIARKMKSLLK